MKVTVIVCLLLGLKVIIVVGFGATLNDVLNVLHEIRFLELVTWLVFAVCLAWYPFYYQNWRASHSGSRETRLVDDGEGNVRQLTSESHWSSPGFESARYSFRLLQLLMIASGVAILFFIIDAGF